MRATSLTALLLTLLLSLSVRAGDYEDAWNAIHQKKLTEAKRLLLKATKNPATAIDAYATLAFIQEYQKDEAALEGFSDILKRDPNKGAYLYALWFKNAGLGGYGKKTMPHLAAVNSVISDKTYHGSIRSAAHYQRGMHYVSSNDFGKSEEEWSRIGALRDWQLAGPFENLSGSGFHNTNGPIANPVAASGFKGINGIDIGWFQPTLTNREGWRYTYAHIPYSTAIIYGQTFVNAAEDGAAILAVGGSGTLKVWVNDALVLTNPQERITELDYYRVPCTLKKGYNRILVQLGYTSNSFPNFIVRLTDEGGDALGGLNSTATPQTYTRAAAPTGTNARRQFAEEFFEKKLKENPTNPVNYVLLSQTYLRNQRSTEARQVVEKALSFAPNDPLLKYELMQCLIKADNRTLLAQEIEWLKENDPESYIGYSIAVNELMQEEKYDEADAKLEAMKAKYGEDERYMETKINLLGQQKKMEEMMALMGKAYAKFPESVDFVQMHYRMKSEVEKDAKLALSVYEKFLKNNYNYGVLSSLGYAYRELGRKDKYLDVLQQMLKNAPYDPDYYTNIADYHFELTNYGKALDYVEQALKLAPYSSRLWNKRAEIQEMLGKKDDAIASLRKAISYDRTEYDARKKLNSLLQKPDLYKQLPDPDIYAQIKKSPAETKYDFSYVYDQKSVIIYEPGAVEEYIHYAVKIHNQKGIDAWKEVYLPSGNSGGLLVEKCEVVKANGSKAPAERSGNEVVFTGLQAGDAIHVKYRVQKYSYGRLGQEFWDKWIFNSFVPSAITRYILIAPKDFAFNHQVINGDIKLTTKPLEDYKVYKWNWEGIPAMETEPYMPELKDIATTLHLSTMKSWGEVATWYSDLAYQDLSNNLELDSTYAQIFSGKETLTPLAKARRIYEYMLANLRYSSVPFRQSGFVPQPVSQIITTRLGDCKDFSSLFAALAKRAGLDAKLVLVDTRDNGTKDMVLPSVEFNHCIVQLDIEGKTHYLELTDNNLSFGALPNNVNGALSLPIPPQGVKPVGALQPLQSNTRTLDKIVRKINLNIAGKEQRFAVDVVRTGHLTSEWRDGYATLPEEKQRENFEQSIGSGYKNPVKLETLRFRGLDHVSDTLGINFSYSVKNEVIEAGSMKMIKLPLFDAIATIDNFSADKRDFPIEYWKYENTDAYETVVTVSLPTGQKFVEIPTGQTLSFKGSTYVLKFVKEGEKLKIMRTAKLQRENVAPADYQAFKKFMGDIVEAESKYIVFK